MLPASARQGGLGGQPLNRGWRPTRERPAGRALLVRCATRGKYSADLKARLAGAQRVGQGVHASKIPGRFGRYVHGRSLRDPQPTPCRQVGQDCRNASRSALIVSA